MIQCYVIDDEQHALNVLERYIAQTAGLALAGTADDPTEALRQITTGEVKCDIAFVDIQMEQLSGMKLAEMIFQYTRVIFTTAHEKFAVKAFENNAADFLLKPISYERFLLAVNKIRSVVKSIENDETIFVQADTRGKIYRLNRNDIQFVESFQHYVKVHTQNDQHMIRKSIKEMERELSFPNFLRIHKSFIVNINQIDNIYGNIVKVKNGATLSIGPNYRSAFINAVNSRMLGS
jgi:DNA-binding LytR/AlgR family response regulator